MNKETTTKQSMAKTQKANLMKALMDKALDMNSNIKLAKNRTKCEDGVPVNEIVTLVDFELATGNIEGKESQFMVLVFAEYPELFYFGGSVVTKNLMNFDESELKLIQENGMPVKFEKIPSKDKKHNDYTKIIFYPEETEA